MLPHSLLRRDMKKALAEVAVASINGGGGWLWFDILCTHHLNGPILYIGKKIKELNSV